MARPNKIGLDYFNIDTDRYQDQKIKRLKNNYGGVGMAVYDYLLCEIYRDKGCYVIWNENMAFDVTDYFRTKETTVNEIVTYCGVVGLFDKAVLMRGMLTSKAIQKRYLLICKNAGRKDWDKLIPQEINLIGEEMEFITEESTQSKGKKKKEKESKEEDLDVRKLKFASTLAPFRKIYGDEIINAFYLYWTEPNKTKTRFRQENEKTWDLQSRLNVWMKHEVIYGKEKNGAQKESKIVGTMRAGEAALNYFENLNNATHTPKTNY